MKKPKHFRPKRRSPKRERIFSEVVFDVPIQSPIPEPVLDEDIIEDPGAEKVIEQPIIKGKNPTYYKVSGSKLDYEDIGSTKNDLFETMRRRISYTTVDAAELEGYISDKLHHVGEDND